MLVPSGLVVELAGGGLDSAVVVEANRVELRANIYRVDPQGDWGRPRHERGCFLRAWLGCWHGNLCNRSAGLDRWHYGWGVLRHHHESDESHPDEASSDEDRIEHAPHHARIVAVRSHRLVPRGLSPDG